MDEQTRLHALSKRSYPRSYEGGKTTWERTMVTYSNKGVKVSVSGGSCTFSTKKAHATLHSALDEIENSIQHVEQRYAIRKR